MGQIANQMALELIFKIKERIKEKKEEKKQEKAIKKGQIYPYRFYLAKEKAWRGDGLPELGNRQKDIL